MLLGGIFGKDFLIGLLIGFVFGIMIIIFQGLIKGPALENSRIYNEGIYMKLLKLISIRGKKG